MRVDASQTQLARWAGGLSHVALAGLVIALYVWTSTSGRPAAFTPENKGYYGRLSEAFLAGRTSFLVTPPPGLAAASDPYDPAGRGPELEAAPGYLHDASYYKGRYYLYFGPVPALVLGVPFRLLTGLDFNEYLMPALFCAGAYLLGMGIVLRVRRILAPNANASAVLAACLVYGLSATQLFFLRRPSVYEASIASGVFFALAAVLVMLPAVVETITPGRRIARLAWGGVFLGLAAGSRHTYALAFPVVAMALWTALRRRPDRDPGGGRPWAAAAAFLLPGAILAAGLLAYNYVRFDSILQTGHGYQLTSLKSDAYGFISWRYIPTNLYLNLFLPLRIDGHFPYFHAVADVPGWLRPAAGYIGGEDVMGALTNIPVLVLPLVLLGLLLAGRLQPDRAGAAATSLVAAPGAVNLAVVMAYSHATMRYLYDVLPFVMLAGAVLFLMLASEWRDRPQARRWTFALAAALAVYGLVANTAIGLTGYLDDFKDNNPSAYGRIKGTVDGTVSLFTPSQAPR